MSKSRSTSLTPDSFSTLNPSDSTTSRTPAQLRSPSRSTLTAKESQPPPFTQVHPLPHQNQSTSTPLESTNSQMTRQLRLEQASRPFLEHSASSYSQESVASTSKGKRPSESTIPSPKKKRTRTLTTPHQAAVLYGLLAKSRFPNAAVREEVGRSIGLSARKVQVWFQNQRQKDRRPQSQSNMSHRLHDNFGTFPSGSGSFPLPPGPSSSYPASTSYSAEMRRSAAREYYTFDQSSYSGESSLQLSGPGTPGFQSSSDLTYRGQRVVLHRPGTASEGFVRYSDLRDRSLRSPSPLRLYSPSPVSNSANASRSYEHDSSRTLPPLSFPPAPPRPSFSAPSSSSGPPRAALDPPHDRERRSLTPVNMFSYQPPESAAPVTWSHSYAVLPQLRRPASSYESTYQSSHSPLPWALHDHGTADRSVTPSTAATERPPSSGVAAAAVRPPERSRRYDPVRGMFIYSLPPEDH